MTSQPSAGGRDTIHRSLVKRGQGLGLTHVFRVQLPGGRAVAVRSTVALDFDRKELSSAKFEVWDDGRWTLVHSLDGYEVPWGDPIVYRDDPTKTITNIEAALSSVGLAILGVNE